MLLSFSNKISEMDEMYLWIEFLTQNKVEFHFIEENNYFAIII